ncbi:MAG: type II toxin-antitoxin system RelE/ParE family toxin [Candidatus Altiarchaeota archaeon]
MAWKITWSMDAIRTLSKMEKPVAKRVLAKIEQAATDPHHHTTRLAGSADFKLRAGDIRILMLLNSSKKTMYIQAIGNRRNIYKKR